MNGQSSTNLKIGVYEKISKKQTCKRELTSEIIPTERPSNTA
jgi:hypothetical protein